MVPSTSIASKFFPILHSSLWDQFLQVYSILNSADFSIRSQELFRPIVPFKSRNSSFRFCKLSKAVSHSAINISEPTSLVRPKMITDIDV
jgi:hypothetical protein